MRLRRSYITKYCFYNQSNFINGYIKLTFSVGYSINDKYIGYNLWHTKPNVKTFII